MVNDTFNLAAGEGISDLDSPSVGVIAAISPFNVL